MSTVRINDKIKNDVTPILEELGLSLSEAINVFLKQVIMTESIPFAIRKPKLNADTIKAIEEAEKGVNLSKGYTNLDEMWNDLEKED